MKLSALVRLGRKDKLPGGLGDKKTREDFDPEQIEKGIKVELEHTDDEDVALEIAIDHLTEDPKYYDKLETIDPHHGSVEGYAVHRLRAFGAALETSVHQSLKQSGIELGPRAAGKDPKIDALKDQVEDLDRTIDQLKRRQEALTGPEVDPNTAEAIRNSIQRRIDAVNEDKQEIQTQIQEMIMQKCGRPGKGKK